MIFRSSNLAAPTVRWGKVVARADLGGHAPLDPFDDGRADHLAGVRYEGLAGAPGFVRGATAAASPASKSSTPGLTWIRRTARPYPGKPPVGVRDFDGLVRQRGNIGLRQRPPGSLVAPETGIGGRRARRSHAAPVPAGVPGHPGHRRAHQRDQAGADPRSHAPGPADYPGRGAGDRLGRPRARGPPGRCRPWRAS
jgi:hypothetical protein